jgi:pyruvate,water dikinase
MKIDDASLAPDVIFKEGKRTAEKAIQELQSIARGTFAGGIKSRLIGSLATRVRALAGLRESPKFHIIQVMGVIRQGMLSYGRQLAREGVLANPEDIFYLYYDELVEVVEKEQRDWQELVEGRKQVYKNEMLRKQIPRLLLSDGRAYYEGISSLQSDEERLVGSPVSPGTVAGKARIVVDPLRADLQPGEILVCRGTDPAWTPLFLTAGGLVMEVGGMMTHGAIVAREYGIPAVVGITRATEVLKTGQQIQVNGSNGEILFLET